MDLSNLWPARLFSGHVQISSDSRYGPVVRVGTDHGSGVEQ